MKHSETEQALLTEPFSACTADPGWYNACLMMQGADFTPHQGAGCKYFCVLGRPLAAVRALDTEREASLRGFRAQKGKIP